MAFDFFSGFAGSEKQDDRAKVRLIVGLGNPGKCYVKTRHNLGFMVVDLVAHEREGKWVQAKTWKAEVAKLDSIILAKPLTFMNLSGDAISRIARHYRLAPSQVLVVYDDVSLPFGKLRIRPKGSAGGHNGVSDTIRALGTDEFPRLKVGIAPQEEARKELSEFVLDEFTNEERSELEKVLRHATQAVTYVLENGVESAMSRFNATG